jgi:hypothetical protein
MSLIFTDEGNGDGKFYDENFEICVFNYYTNSYPGETADTQHEKIRRMLAGERGLRAMFSNCDGESQFEINDEGVFILQGGQFGPTFGHTVRIICDYESNKEELDKFLNFMLKGEDDD